MFSTPEGLTNNIPRSPMTPTPVNKPSARKSLFLFTNILDVKNKYTIRLVRASKSNRNAVKKETMLWSMKTKGTRNSKINNQIKNFLYNWIISHPQVVQSPILMTV